MYCGLRRARWRRAQGRMCLGRIALSSWFMAEKKVSIARAGVQ
jgi:hypothetical protein